MHKVLPLLFSLFLISNSTNAMDGPTLDWKEDTLDIQKKDLHAARYLKTPFIRQSIKNYSEQCDTSPKKLALGAGHIYDIHSLHPEYQENGDNELTSDYLGGYALHQHKGWYTVSAEVDAAFGSDMVLDLRNFAHLNTLFPAEFQNFWDIVFDESYHPGVFCAPGLIAQIAHGLKEGGVYIFTLPIEKEGDFFVAGKRYGHEEESAYFANKLYTGDVQFKSIIDAEDYIATEIVKLGFTEVRLYTSPLSLALIRCFGDEGAPENLKDLTPVLTIAKPLAEQSVAAQIDPLFRDVGLGTYYVIAKK